MTTITLKDKDDVDVVFTLGSRNGNQEVFYSAGSSLLDTKRLTLNLKENAATNRIIAKLSVPTVGTIPSTGIPGVLWTEIGSFDLSAVRSASNDAANNFVAMFASLAGCNYVKSLYTTGVSA